MSCLGSMAWWCRKGSFSIYYYNEIMYELPSHNIIYLIPAHAYFRSISTTKSNRAEVDPLAKCEGRRSRQMRDCGGCRPSSNTKREQEVVGDTHPANSRSERRVEPLAVMAQPIESEMQTMGGGAQPTPIETKRERRWRWRLSQHTPIERETRTMSGGGGCHSTCLSNARRE